MPGETLHTWRDDDKVHRVIVEAGDANDASSVGFYQRHRDPAEQAAA